MLALKIWRHYLYGEKLSHFHGSQKYEVFDVPKRTQSTNLSINYHPGKANIVVDALSRKSFFSLRAINTRLMLTDDGSILAELEAKPTFLQEICKA